jgi:hypothetical protein
MDDLIERLRGSLCPVSGDGDEDKIAAAAEIERLRRELAEALNSAAKAAQGWFDSDCKWARWQERAESAESALAVANETIDLLREQLERTELERDTQRDLTDAAQSALAALQEPQPVPRCTCLGDDNIGHTGACPRL